MLYKNFQVCVHEIGIPVLCTYPDRDADSLIPSVAHCLCTWLISRFLKYAMCNTLYMFSLVVSSRRLNGEFIHCLKSTSTFTT
jgi:hypothetical protein